MKFCVGIKACSHSLSNSWALISHQTWFYLTIYTLNALNTTSLYACRTNLIVPCQNTSCYILHIYFSCSEISTHLINNQTYDTTKRSILSIETLNDRGNYLQQNNPPPLPPNSRYKIKAPSGYFWGD